MFVKTLSSYISGTLFVLLLLGISPLKAQDIHFSQFGNSPINLNPGLAGVFGGDLRFVGNYRSQWRSIPVPYSTFSGSVENKLYWTKGRYDRYLTGGLMLNHDKQGSLKLTSTRIAIPISVTIPVTQNNFLTLGIMPAFGQRHIGGNKFTADAQWNDCMWDPLADIRETQLLSAPALKYFDLGAGINYRWQAKGKRTRLDAGFGWQHINRPSHDFWSSDLSNPGNVRLYDRKSGYLLGLAQVAGNWDIMAQGIYQGQGAYRELVYGAGLRLHLDQNPYRELALQVGVDYRARYQDALIPHIELLYRTWTLGFTYDVNISGAQVLTDRRGGPEVSLIYRLYRVKPLPKFKSCPII
jgi:type IX secretion system PorP/SprF family membrane protein